MENSINRSALYTASCIALIATAMAFGIRAGILNELGVEFGLSETKLGIVISTAFWGFTLAMIFGGSLVDYLGMRKLIILAFFFHFVGIVMTIFAQGFWSLFISTLIVGIANGTVEAVCNPLITTLYPEKKTHKLNLFHFWFPGGIVISTLITLAFSKLGLGWQYQIATMLIPTFIYGFMFYSKSFPVTERVSSGVSNEDMLKACLTPLFLIMVVLMFITASTEFGVNNWIPLFLQEGETSSILILTWVTLIMALGRLLLGPIVHQKLSPQITLLIAAIITTIGIYWLTSSTGTEAYVAAAVFGLGVSFFWPTMLGFVAEYIPNSGSLGLGIMGGAGMLASAFALPVLGKMYEDNKEKLGNDLIAGIETLYDVIYLPVFLSVAFLILVLYMRGKARPGAH
jgi:MFS family permease